MSDEGRKNDEKKSRVDLLSQPALFGLGDVLGFGANKYEADNWRRGVAWRRLIGGLLRHSLEFAQGKNIDSESGLPIIDHVGCCWMFLSEYQKLNLGTDDRHTAPPELMRKTFPPKETLDLIIDLKNRVARCAATNDSNPFGAIGEGYPLVTLGEARQLLQLFEI